MSGFVFISYSRGERPYVERLTGWLAERGIRAWYDYELLSGDRFMTVIQERIKACSAFIPVLTPAAVRSEFVNLELSYARTLGKPIHPLMLKTSDLPFIIHDLHCESVIGGSAPPPSFMAAVAKSMAGATSTRPQTLVPMQSRHDDAWYRDQLHAIAQRPAQTGSGTVTVSGVVASVIVGSGTARLNAIVLESCWVGSDILLGTLYLAPQATFSMGSGVNRANAVVLSYERLYGVAKENGWL